MLHHTSKCMILNTYMKCTTRIINLITCQNVYTLRTRVWYVQALERSEMRCFIGCRSNNVWSVVNMRCPSAKRTPRMASAEWRAKNGIRSGHISMSRSTIIGHISMNKRKSNSVCCPSVFISRCYWIANGSEIACCCFFISSCKSFIACIRKDCKKPSCIITTFFRSVRCWSRSVGRPVTTSGLPLG